MKKAQTKKMPQMARDGKNQYGHPKPKILCSECEKLLGNSNFSYIDKNNTSKGKRSICKKCSRNKKEREKRNRTWQDDVQTMLYNLAKQRAKKAGILFTITKKDVIIPDICPVLGIKLKREDRKTWNTAPSIDRIDNTKGYEPDNIMVISRRANLLKRDATIQELVTIGKFYEHFLS